METVFLVCFIFGALFSVVSALMGVADVGIHLPHGGHDGGFGHHGHGNGDAGGHHALPVLNLSALLAFLTWFGAAGYLFTQFAGWGLLLTLPVAIVTGAIGALIIARFLGLVMAGERVMNPADYQLEGTVARVSVSIPSHGVGEIIFSMGGVRRSEAARAATPESVTRGTEVVVLDYAHGVATVQPYSDLLHSERTPELEPQHAPARAEGERTEDLREE